MTARFLDRLPQPPTREEYLAALAQVPDDEPDPWDLWPEDERRRALQSKAPKAG